MTTVGGPTTAAEAGTDGIVVSAVDVAAIKINGAVNVSCAAAVVTVTGIAVVISGTDTSRIVVVTVNIAGNVVRRMQAGVI